MTPRKSAKKPAPPTLLAYKGLDKNFRCRDFQYEVGKTYTHKGEVRACESGFHSCENPFDVWSYYDIIDSRFAEVEVGGELSRHEDDTKIASASIAIKAELSLPQFIQRGIDYLINLTKNVKADVAAGNVSSDEDDAQIGSSGYGAQIGSSGYGAQIGSSGYDAQIGSSGYGAQIGSSGNDAQIGSSGNDAQIGSSGYGARIGSSGNYARIGSSGHSAHIGSSGDSAQIEASGENSIVACAGSVYRFKLGPNGCITIPYHDGTRVRFAAAYVGENGIKAGVWYQHSGNGSFAEVV